MTSTPTTPDAGTTGTTAPPMYSPGQVAAAAFLGSPMAGTWLLAANYRVLGSPGAAKKALVWGFIATVAILAIPWPEKMPNVVLPAAYTFALRELARREQGSAFEAHVAKGGPTHSAWRVFGVGMGFLVAVLLVVVGVVLVMPGE